MLCLVGGQGVGKSTFIRFLCLNDRWFTDDIKRLDDDKVYEHLAGHWICEMAEMLAVLNTKYNEAIPLWQRYSLSVPEAAKYFGIGETRLYQIVAEHPGADFILEIGSHVKIKRVLFERFLDAAS